MNTSNVYSFFHSSKVTAVLARKSASVLTMVAMVFGSFAPIVAFPASALAIIVPPTTLFSDGFDSGTYNAWTSGNPEAGKWEIDNSGHVGKAARAKGDNDTTKTLREATSTAGYSGITLSYWYRAKDLDSAVGGHHPSPADTFDVQWSPDGTTWNTLFTISDANDNDTWTSKSHSLPAGADNKSGFQIRFKSDLHDGNNKVLLDQVVLTGAALPATLTVTKVVEGGSKVVSDFPLTLNSLSITSGVATTTAPGTYTVAETSDPAYTGVFSGDCDAAGHITLVAGDSKTCTLTNTVKPTQVVVHKVIDNTGGGEASYNAFSFTIDDSDSINFDSFGYATSSVAAGAYAVAEDNNASYTPAYSAGCSGTIAEGETKDCTITNTYIIPQAPSCDAQLSNAAFVSDETTMVGADAAVHTWVHPAWLPESGGAEWIWSTAEVADPSATTTVDFTKTFSVTGTITGGSLQIAADNGYTVTLNGNPVCSADPYSSHYAAFDTCVIPAGSFVAGTNTLAIEVVNAAYDTQDPHTNPAGVMYKLTVDKNACIPQSDVTICKYSDQQQSLSGWSMTLKGDNVEDLVVPTGTSLGINTVNTLLSGVSYIATAVGTWLNQGTANPVDAEYSTTDGWTTHMDGYTGYQTDILELQINSAFDPNSDWGAYNSAHTYAQAFTGTGASTNFRIFDGTGTTVNDGWYSDNTGTLAVNIAKGYAGITGENGCVTFKAVPTGTYTLGEVMQDGWNNVSGLGEVVVSHATEAFNVVNHFTPPAEQCNPNASSTIVSDATTQEDGHDSALVSFIHTSWTAVIGGASWIWGEDLVADPANVSTETFTKTFNVIGTPLGATLDLAADNTFSVAVNGNDVCASAAENNFSATTTCAIPASVLNTGTNTLVFTVTNLQLPEGYEPVNAETNPAGLLYKLTINNNECVTPEASSVKVHLYKYLRTHDGETAIDTQVLNDSLIASFPMKATWDAIIGGNPSTGTDVDYVLGNYHGQALLKYAADTSPMQAPVAHYTSYENTSDTNVLPIGAECTADKYRLVGYKSGISLPAAEGASLQSTAPDYTNFNSDKYIIVVNEDCNDVIANQHPTTGTLTIVKHTVGGNDTFLFEVSDSEETLATSTSLTTGENNAATSTDIALTSGTYDVQEFLGEGQSNWHLTGVSCTYDGGSVGESITNGEHITLNAGDHVTCTFTNTKDSEEEDAGTPAVTARTATPGNGGFGFGVGGFGGAVLGAATSTVTDGAVCSTPLLYTYLRRGKHNDVAEVKKLQNFLNGELGLSIPLTGYFGPLTDAAVRKFQLKYAQQILDPWHTHGLPEDTSTGYVYKTTQRWINLIYCSALNIPTPQLP